MKRLIIAAVIAMALPLSLLADCAATAKIVDPVISESARSDFETKLKSARADFEKSPNDADAAIWSDGGSHTWANTKNRSPFLPRG